jgi:DnaJ-class molecular chaperone
MCPRGSYSFKFLTPRIFAEQWQTPQQKQQLARGFHSSARNMTHYERLGIRPPSDPKEIKLAYLKRAKACHPGKVLWR